MGSLIILSFSLCDQIGKTLNSQFTILNACCRYGSCYHWVQFDSAPNLVLENFTVSKKLEVMFLMVHISYHIEFKIELLCTDTRPRDPKTKPADE